MVRGTWVVFLFFYLIKVSIARKTQLSEFICGKCFVEDEEKRDSFCLLKNELFFAPSTYWSFFVDVELILRFFSVTDSVFLCVFVFIRPSWIRVSVGWPFRGGRMSRRTRLRPGRTSTRGFERCTAADGSLSTARRMARAWEDLLGSLATSAWYASRIIMFTTVDEIISEQIVMTLKNSWLKAIFGNLG